MTNNNVNLRPLQKSDLELVLSWRNHPNVRRFMYTQHEISAEEHREWFDRTRDDQNRYQMIFEQQDQPTGFVNFNIVDPQGKRANWGFYLSPEASAGSGRLLGITALNYAFEHLYLHKVCGEALAYNMPSIRFHERLGFTREAILREHHFDGIKYHDVIGFGMLGTEWSNR
ncbi:UDP-4-amino-4,6-dideoxy-N-acetyl-beta-L-altrosamine N-acetyltransferase [Halomonas sp. 5021]|uniref:UDP-4-amino-4, 6-dideoxy-N-acetyl-beta-L-altrosamine N-acetyltransferase n=1 Tax=Halomonas sp. 5021 TaxID=3082156 RepID=UPI002FC8748A